jgi:hypothetical protein
MNDGELAQCYAALGVQPGVSLDELERVFMKRNFSLLKGRAGAADEANPELDRQRQVLRGAYERVAEHLREQQVANAGRKRPQLVEVHPPRPPPPAATLLAPPPAPPRRAEEEFALFAFDNWKVNTFVPPVLLALVFLVVLSPLQHLLLGASVWMHEVGHAIPAWLAGWRATPLPIGWTPVEQVHSNFVYFGVLALLLLFFLAGLKERKLWPMLVAVPLAGLQFHMTWLMPEHRKEFWMIFGGIGGEFGLGTLLMMSFWVQLPEKFKWHYARYFFFLLGATAFVAIWWRWRDIYRGLEEIPFGSMINGEDDANGDMNRLMNEYGWRKFDIRRTYYLLGNWCWIALGVTWLAFALRLNKVADWVVGRWAADRGILKTENRET